MRQRISHIMLVVMVLLLTPMVVVMPWFQHSCEKSVYSEDLTSVESHCGSSESISDLHHSCCTDGAECGECAACGMTVKGFAFIDHTIVPAKDDNLNSVPVFDIPSIYGETLKIDFSTYSILPLLFVPPSPPGMDNAQSKLCVFIC